MPIDPTFDIFISYSHHDKDWVHSRLLSQLEATGLRVCIDFRDFEPGLPSLVNMENAVERSRKTLIVLTPAWVESEWTAFESLLIQTDDPAGRRRRMIPLLLKPCDPPKRIAILTRLDFTDPAQFDFQMNRLIRAIKPDIDRIGEEQVQKELLMEPTGSEIPAPRAGERAQYDEKTLYLAGAAFEEHILELLEKGQTFVVRRYLQSAPTVFFKHVESLDKPDASHIQTVRDNYLLPVLDNLVVLGVVLIHYAERQLFDELEDVFYRMCKQAPKVQFPKLKERSLHFSSSWVWREVITRVYALGAVLVYEKKYEWISALIRRPIEWEESYWRDKFWARYILTMLAREGQLEEKSLCRLAVTHIESSDHLARFFWHDRDEIIAVTCQFDFLQCIQAISETHRVADGYPSFGIYNNYRTEPIIAELVTGGPARVAIPDISDDLLADIIRGLDQLAGEAFFLYNGWDSNSWSDKSIGRFLVEHPPSGEILR